MTEAVRNAAIITLAFLALLRALGYLDLYLTDRRRRKRRR
jgi:hypothetical protein